MMVFIVDDSAVVRERIVSMLSELRKVVIVGQAERSQEAIKAIKKTKPDVVILDIRKYGYVEHHFIFYGDTLHHAVGRRCQRRACSLNGKVICTAQETPALKTQKDKIIMVSGLVC